MRRLGPRTTVLLVLASSAALLGAMPARAVWLPQLRLEHLRVVVLQRDGAQLMLLAASGASGFALGESRRVTCVVPVPRGARVARGGVGPQAISDALTLVDRLRTTRAQTPRAPELARVAVEQTMLLEGSTAAIDALLRGELRLSGASPPSDDALAFYRQRDWTFLIARAHPSRPPPYTFGPIAVAFRTERPHVPLRMLARRPPLTIDVVLVTALQPVLDRDSLAARGLVYTELVDTPHDAPEGAVPSAPTQDVPLALPFSQLPWGELPASLRAVASAHSAGQPGVSWRDEELVHVAHILGRLEGVERWSDDLVFDVSATPTASPSAPAAPTSPPVVIVPTSEVPTGPPSSGGCGCRVVDRSVRREAFFAVVLVLATLGRRVLRPRGRLRGRRFSRDPWQAVNRR